MECGSGNTWQRTGCIFTYNGEMKDILINYFMVVMNLAYCTALVWKHDRKHVALWCLLGVITFQWTLCLAVACSGISIIWCAMCGWAMDLHRRQQGQEPPPAQRLETSAPTSHERSPGKFLVTIQEYGTGIILLNVIVVVYYTIVMEAITTVAHICALILGALLHIWLFAEDPVLSVEAAAIPLLQGSPPGPVPASEISGTM